MAAENENGALVEEWQGETEYTKPLFYVLVVFKKKVDVNKKGVNQKRYSHKK
jgi:hypothetical protein